MSISIRDLLVKALEDKNSRLIEHGSAVCDIECCELTGDDVLRINGTNWYLCPFHFEVVKNKLEGL